MYVFALRPYMGEKCYFEKALQRQNILHVSLLFHEIVQ
jgi:hypothetical protein